MRETPDIETSSADYATRFAGAAGQYFLDRQAETIAKLLVDGCGTTVLDVGGGHGQLTSVLLSAGFNVTIVGSSEDCFSRLAGDVRVRDVSFITGDMLELPFSEQSFDLVISVRLVSHIRDWPKLLQEFCRVAKHTVIIDYPSKVGVNALGPLLFKLKKRVERNTRTYTSFHKKDLARELDKNAFEIKETRGQFFLPMVVHRATNGSGLLRALEHVFAITGITKFLGSPILLRADRKQS